MTPEERDEFRFYMRALRAEIRGCETLLIAIAILLALILWRVW